MIPKKINDTMTATSLYRVISWPGYYYSINFYIDVPNRVLHISKESDPDELNPVAWKFEMTGTIEDLMKYVAIFTIELNGYFEPMLTAEGFIKVREKCLTIYDRSLKAQRMAFERGA